jgi:hypothetical protein
LSIHVEFKNYSGDKKYRIKIETGRHIKIWEHQGLAQYMCTFINEAKLEFFSSVSLIKQNYKSCVFKTLEELPARKIIQKEWTIY